MATDHDERLRKAILHAVAFQGPEWPKTGEWTDNSEEDHESLKEQEEMLLQLSGKVHFLQRRYAWSHKLYGIEVNDGSGMGSTMVYAIVDEDRIKTILDYVEGATVVIYNAEYGEEGMGF